MSREGRAQPIQPFASHGFLDNTPANGVLPGLVTVVENDDRRRKQPLLQPVVLSGVLAPTAPVFVAPPASVNVDQPARPRVTPVTQTATHGAVDNTPVFVAPPAPLVVPLTDPQRARTPQPPNASTSFDDIDPPPPAVVEPDSRRRFRVNIDPVVLSAALLPVQQPPDVLPTGPYVVPLDERRRFLAALPPTSSHGFLGNTPANGTLPPPPVNLDRADQRVRYKPLDPILLTAALLGDGLPPAPVVVQGGTDWASAIATW